MQEAKVGGRCKPALVPGLTPERKIFPLVKRVAGAVMVLLVVFDFKFHCY
jgi:hypothetical protein